MTTCVLLLIAAGLVGLGLALATPANIGATALLALLALLMVLGAFLAWPRHRRLPLVEAIIHDPRR